MGGARYAHASTPLALRGGPSAYYYETNRLCANIPAIVGPRPGGRPPPFAHASHHITSHTTQLDEIGAAAARRKGSVDVDPTRAAKRSNSIACAAAPLDENKDHGSGEGAAAASGGGGGIGGGGDNTDDFMAELAAASAAAASPREGGLRERRGPAAIHLAHFDRYS